MAKLTLDIDASKLEAGRVYDVTFKVGKLLTSITGLYEGITESGKTMIFKDLHRRNKRKENVEMGIPVALIEEIVKGKFSV